MDKKRLAVFIDYENIFIGMKDQFLAIPDPARIVSLLTEDFKKRGEIVIGKAYAGWEDFPGLQAEFKKMAIDPMYVLTKHKKTGDDGYVDVRFRKNSADIALSLDAQDILRTRSDIDNFIFVTGDRDFLEIISRCKQHGKTIVIYGVGYTISQDLQRAADEVVKIETLFGLSPIRKPFPGTNKPSSPEFDWMPFIITLEQLESSLPFVGLKYFRDKILNPGIGSGEDMASKMQLITEAISQEIVKIEKVPNKEGLPYPVTAIKLNRDHPSVKGCINLIVDTSRDSGEKHLDKQQIRLYTFFAHGVSRGK
jgi:uncharacterized LabA/DUF88 family protein